ncbi:MAG: hypothetical protein LIO91_08065 [Bacteroidales bacterium]|nr:hypothetical protein [Bacteroidales bacterium]
MSCDCENRKRASELMRVRDLARRLAVMEQTPVAIYARDDGTYTFQTAATPCDLNPIEIINPH